MRVLALSDQASWLCQPPRQGLAAAAASRASAVLLTLAGMCCGREPPEQNRMVNLALGSAAGFAAGAAGAGPVSRRWALLLLQQASW